MQRVTLLCVGSLKNAWVREGCSDYLVRLMSDIDLQIAEIPASKKRDPDAQREDECTRLLDALKKRSGTVWILDERGKGMTSEQFSGALSDARDRGEDMLFILGGAYGLTDEIRVRGRKTFSLSPMTFPHELCRLIFLEQLYRAAQIARGSGYHH